MHALVVILFAASLFACEGSCSKASDETKTKSTTASTATDEVTLRAKELLGKQIFEDTNLSEPRGQSCASCHVATLAFTGNSGSSIDAVAAGSRTGIWGTRNVPTIMYAKYAPQFALFFWRTDDEDLEPVVRGGLFLDGRAATLAEQAKGPFLNVREMNNPDKGTVVTKIREGTYASLFRSVYGSTAFDDVDSAYDHVADAIAAFERTPRFAPFSSKFDDVLRGKAKFTQQEARGFKLFRDPNKGNCIGCHAGDEKSREPSDWLFTDFSFDNIGVPRNMKIPDNADPNYFDLGVCKQEKIAQMATPNFDPEWECGKFKVPTLRNVEVTAPYMHNGFFTDLRDAVRFYATRDTDPELWYPKDADGNVLKFNDVPPQYRGSVNVEEVPYDREPGDPPRLTDDEIDAIVAFLKTLTDR